MNKIIKLCKAARKSGVEVTIFFTHFGTLLTRDSRFEELEDLARIDLCKVAFESQGLRPPIPGIDEKCFATQAKHADLIEECDRYVVF